MPLLAPAASLLERLGLPSAMAVDPDVRRRLVAVEALPPVARRHAVAGYIADREAELETLATAHPSASLLELRVDDELLSGLHLIRALL